MTEGERRRKDLPLNRVVTEVIPEEVPWSLAEGEKHLLEEVRRRAFQGNRIANAAAKSLVRWNREGAGSVTWLRVVRERMVA